MICYKLVKLSMVILLMEVRCKTKMVEMAGHVYFLQDEWTPSYNLSLELLSQGQFSIRLHLALKCPPDFTLIACSITIIIKTLMGEQRREVEIRYNTCRVSYRGGGKLGFPPPRSSFPPPKNLRIIIEKSAQ